MDTHGHQPILLSDVNDIDLREDANTEDRFVGVTAHCRNGVSRAVHLEIESIPLREGARYRLVEVTAEEEAPKSNLHPEHSDLPEPGEWTDAAKARYKKFAEEVRRRTAHT